jgi:hypothetical protein
LLELETVLVPLLVVTDAAGPLPPLPAEEDVLEELSVLEEETPAAAAAPPAGEDADLTGTPRLSEVI